MRGFLRETYNYAILLVILFGIAAIAVWQTLDFLHGRVPAQESGVVSVLIWSLTLGFMLIAGAFGLWAVQFSAQAESRRRVGRVVEAMDYLHDGLLALDRKGRVSGCNPAARRIQGGAIQTPAALRAVFSCLSEDDERQLLRSRDPVELERAHSAGGDARVLRFRSQPLEGMTLLLVSDVTTLSAQRRHNRHMARLQLIGQIARGVAHDFNNILCAISGHASLLRRLPPGSPETAASLRMIAQSVERGSALATHLIELARPVAALDPAGPEPAAFQMAADALRTSLPADWRIETRVDPLPALPLSVVQMEQIVINLGLHIAESTPEPGILRVFALPTIAGSPLLDPAGGGYAAAVLLSAGDLAQMLTATASASIRGLGDSGVILSIVRTLVEESGGTIQIVVLPGCAPVYRVMLPRAPAVPQDAIGADAADGTARDLAALVAGWSILLGRAEGSALPYEARLDAAGLRVRKAAGIPALLRELSGTEQFQAILLDRSLLAREGEGVLRAALRLAPTAGIVVTGELPAGFGDLAPNVGRIAASPTLRALLNALIEAHGRAALQQGARSASAGLRE